MSIESDIFKRVCVDLKKLEKYGFKKKFNNYVYEENFLNDDFKAIITVDYEGNVFGKVVDLSINEEYMNIKTEMQGEFVNKVRESYIDILTKIRDNCFEVNHFIFKQSNIVNNYIKNKYGSNPEFLWNKFPLYAVYRNKNNKKWFSIIMNLDRSKLDNNKGEVEVINLKLDACEIQELLKCKGFYKAYHMSKTDWITVILDGTLGDDLVFSLIDKSYNLVNEKEEWLVPCNPKYYDIVNCFNDTDSIIWKQTSDIHLNDIVYLYVGKPFSKIMYKCLVVNVNIPYEYKDKNIKMNYVMRLKLLKRFESDCYSFDFLCTHGIKSVRGPRRLLKNISKLIK